MFVLSLLAFLNEDETEENPLLFPLALLNENPDFDFDGDLKYALSSV